MNRLSLQQAQELLLERVEQIKETEKIVLWDVTGRVLAEDITATRNQPPFPRSPLDGYAVRSEDLKEATREHPVYLKVLEEVTAGHVAREYVSENTAVRIMTGALIPEGADCIVGQEDTDYGEDVVAVYQEIRPYENYCMEGEDYKAGQKLLSEGTMLGAVEAGVLASLGMEQIPVYRKVKVALLTTGDEILLPGEELSPGKIYDSNLYTLGTRLLSWGMEVTCRERVGDAPRLAAKKIEQAAERADIIITTGGVSVGKKDIMHEVLEILSCEKLFWRIAIKPGMPTLCAQYHGKLLICLSGNPYGAAANLELLVRPVLAKMSGRTDLQLKRVHAVAENEFPKKSSVTRYVRAHYNNGYVRIADGSNASGILSSMCGCNCMIEIPAGTERLNKGDRVWVVML
ncbi:gephyrin-like molybdotransferase Glp [Dorea sp. YH-dor228]|uniref:molybdopterin molybdotransferase MoeA n=1 Tax=Lachnospiraceae TaxID=186803 RepID=UPI003073B72A|nr:molybdopterin molybdotransferase MoeA [Lachnospiraceae bacterium]